jgi:hypothetical protein
MHAHFGKTVYVSVNPCAFFWMLGCNFHAAYDHFAQLSPWMHIILATNKHDAE